MGGRLCQGGRSADRGRARQPRAAVQVGHVRAHVPVLLALRFAAALLCQGDLVHPHVGLSRPAGGEQQQDQLVPEHIKEGRFGNWLENNVDWALGRDRYWGTPLPIWRSDAPGSTYMECIGSVAELEEKVGRKLQDLDLHRPYVDELTWTAPDGGTMRRVTEVADCWFDSGSMPVAQWHYPFENQEVWQRQQQADYICEAIDQTRGWFYTLHAVIDAAV